MSAARGRFLHRPAEARETPEGAAGISLRPVFDPAPTMKTPPAALPPALEGAVRRLRDALPRLVAVYLFGSHGEGNAHPESDVDLAFLAEEALPAAARWELQETLAGHLGRDVDLVDLRRASTVMQMQVLGGRLLYEGDRVARQLFEATTYAAYALLNEERRAILEDVHRRGTSYGERHDG